jgi:DNA-binding CsgD family transcriptional regulator
MGKPLGYRDLRQLDLALRELYAHTDFLTLPQHLVALLARVVPCEISTYNEVDKNELRSVHNYHSPDAAKYFPQFVAFRHQYPLTTYFGETGDNSAIKVTDFLSRGQFENTALFNEFYRVFDIRYQMGFYLPRFCEFLIGMILMRSHRDFSERDRRVLNLLSPHFAQAWQNARQLMVASQQSERLAQAFSRTRQGMALLDHELRVVWMTDLTGHWLETYFAGERRGASGLPESLQCWVSRMIAATGEQFIGGAREPLIVARGDRRLRVRWMPEIPVGEQDKNASAASWLVLCEENDARSVAALSALGMTRREAQVLHWMAEGKSNPEIGAILQTSANTVRKHVEHILAKLEVESRVAAVRRVWELRMER